MKQATILTMLEERVLRRVITKVEDDYVQNTISALRYELKIEPTISSKHFKVTVHTLDKNGEPVAGSEEYLFVRAKDELEAYAIVQKKIDLAITRKKEQKDV